VVIKTLRVASVSVMNCGTYLMIMFRALHRS